MLGFDVFRKFHRSVKLLFGKRPPDQLLDFPRLFVLSLVVHGGDERTSFHFVGCAVLPVFVENGGVAEA